MIESEGEAPVDQLHELRETVNHFRSKADSVNELGALGLIADILLTQLERGLIATDSGARTAPRPK